MKTVTIRIRALLSKPNNNFYTRIGTTYAVDRIKDGVIFGETKYRKFFTTLKEATSYSMWLEDFYNELGIPTKRASL